MFYFSDTILQNNFIDIFESSICTIDYYTPIAENGFIAYDGLFPDNLLYFYI
jgi:hypothetical protein